MSVILPHISMKRQGLMACAMRMCCCRHQADTRIGEIQAAADARLGSLTAASRQQYSEHLSEQANLMAEASRFEEGLSELDRQLSRAEGELARNGFKQRALELQVNTAAVMSCLQPNTQSSKCLFAWLCPPTASCSTSVHGFSSLLLKTRCLTVVFGMNYG